MAKNKPQTAGSATTEVPEKLSKADLIALFNLASEADTALEAANKAVEKAMAERSKAVEAISLGIGGKGPIMTPDGKLVTIRTRSIKDGTAEKNVIGHTWFFVGQGDAEIVDLS